MVISTNLFELYKYKSRCFAAEDMETFLWLRVAEVRNDAGMG